MPGPPPMAITVWLTSEQDKVPVGAGDGDQPIGREPGPGAGWRDSLLSTGTPLVAAFPAALGVGALGDGAFGEGAVGLAIETGAGEGIAADGDGSAEGEAVTVTAPTALSPATDNGGTDGLTGADACLAVVSNPASAAVIPPMRSTAATSGTAARGQCHNGPRNPIRGDGHPRPSGPGRGGYMDTSPLWRAMTQTGIAHLNTFS